MERYFETDLRGTEIVNYTQTAFEDLTIIDRLRHHAKAIPEVAAYTFFAG